MAGDIGAPCTDHDAGLADAERVAALGAARSVEPERRAAVVDIPEGAVGDDRGADELARVADVPDVGVAGSRDIERRIPGELT